MASGGSKTERKSRPAYSRNMSPLRSSDGYAGIRVSADWDHLFFHLLQKVEVENLLLQQQLLLSGTEIVVWGAIHLEALANRRLREFTERLLKEPEHHESFWRVMRTADIKRKLETIGDLTNTKKRLLVLLLKRTMKLFDLRNRIVHYKENATHIPNASELPDFILMWNTMDVEGPLTELEKEFTPTAVAKLKVDALRVSNWLFRVKL